MPLNLIWNINKNTQLQLEVYFSCFKLIFFHFTHITK